MSSKLHSFTGDRPRCQNQNCWIPDKGEITPSCWLTRLWSMFS